MLRERPGRRGSRQSFPPSYFPSAGRSKTALSSRCNSLASDSPVGIQAHDSDPDTRQIAPEDTSDLSQDTPQTVHLPPATAHCSCRRILAPLEPPPVQPWVW